MTAPPTKFRAWPFSTLALASSHFRFCLKKSYVVLALSVVGLLFLSAHFHAIIGSRPRTWDSSRSSTQGAGGDPTTVARFHPSETDRIAFLFYVQRSLPLALLWARFFENHESFFSLYLYTKLGRPLELPEPFSSANRLSHDPKRGSFSIMEAQIGLLSSALEHESNKRFVLLSETCIPLYKFEYVYHYLMDTPVSFVDILTDPEGSSLSRYNEAFLPEVPQSAWTKGSQWFEMTDLVARIVTQDTLLYPKFKQLCPSTASPDCVPDEHFLPTLLRNSGLGSQLAGRSITWTNWTECSNCTHPHSYDEMSKARLRLIRSNSCQWNNQEGYPCFLFARRFNAQAMASLLSLKDQLGY